MGAPIPVVVGCGLTGCAISRSLSRAGISHLIVGPAPVGDGPRLGESLNLEGSLDILEYFPELADRCISKSAVTAHLGAMEVRCDLNMQRGRASTMFYAALGYKRPPDAFLHVDRRGYDAAAFEVVRADPRCAHLDATVDAVEYDPRSDRVQALIAGGERITPSVVFDATNHVRAVARHLDLQLTVLGPPQRSAYAHFEVVGGQAPGELWHTTHVVRLTKRSDDVEAMAWFIPLRGLVSLGLGLDHGDPRDDRELVALTLAALERRGIVTPGLLRWPEEVRALPRYLHFIHDRAWGRNWMLAGGTFCVMSFAASAGVSSGFSAANCAPHFIADPTRYGPRYEALLADLRSPHEVFEWIARVDPETTTVAGFERKGGLLVERSVLRLALGIRLRPGLLRNAVAGLIAQAIRAGRFDPAGICVHARHDDDPTTREQARLDALAAILRVFAGAAPLAEIDAHLHEDVIVHIDRMRFVGASGWRKWTRHSHATWGFRSLRFETVDHRYDATADQLDVTIVAVGAREGAEQRSEAARFRYRFEGDRVREIWTSRRNYTFLYGPRFARLPGFLLHVARLSLWNLRRRAR